MQTANSLEQLITSGIEQNLNEPCKISDVSWIKPMKFVGIWWALHTKQNTWYAGPKHGANTINTKRYIDFAAKHNIGGVLAEGWNEGWETWTDGALSEQNYVKPYPDFNLDEVVKYGKSKNVEFISHFETGGNIPMFEAQMDTAFSLLKKENIVAVKTGYAGGILPKGNNHHGQYMVNHFQKVVELAAKNHVMLDVHEPIKPTGIDRTYPNILSQEGARGHEWCATYKTIPPYHSTILPFTRMLAGPYDYTPGIFHIIHTPEKQLRVNSTLANQLALFVTIFSPLQMAADIIENYESNPAFQFIADVPTVWHETRVPCAKLGEYVVIARRYNENWYIGGQTNQIERLCKLPMAFLKSNTSYIATIYCDSKETNWKTNPEAIEIKSVRIKSTDTVYIAMDKCGGFAISIVPENISTSNSIKTESVSIFNSSANAKMKAFATTPKFGKEEQKHKAYNAKVNYLKPYSSQYTGGGDSCLTNGFHGDMLYNSGYWQGYRDNEMDIILDLGKLTEIKSITIPFLQSYSDWIFLPSKVEISYSADGKNYSDSKYFVFDENLKAKETTIEEFKMQFVKMSARYVHLRAYTRGNCPENHPGNGQKAWIFCDEVMVE